MFFFSNHKRSVRLDSLAITILTLGILLSLSANGADKTRIVFSSPQQVPTPALLFFTAVFKEAFRRNNVIFSTQFVPAERSLRWSNSGKIDGELIRIQHLKQIFPEETNNLIRLEHSLQIVDLSAFSINNSIINDWQSLSFLKVHYVRGIKIIERHLSQVTPKPQTNTSNTLFQALKMLAAHRTDVVIGNKIIIDQLTRNHVEFKDIKFRRSLEKLETYAYMHIKHRDLALKVALTIQEMIADNSYDALYQLHLNEPHIKPNIIIQHSNY